MLTRNLSDSYLPAKLNKVLRSEHCRISTAVVTGFSWGGTGFRVQMVGTCVKSVAAKSNKN